MMLRLQIFLSCALLTTVAAADVFELSSGGSVEGELLNPDQSPRQQYLVKLPSGGQVTLNRDQVLRVVTPSDAMTWYKKWLPHMPNTLEGNWIMAQECQKRGLNAERNLHLEQVLKFDPDHEKAHYALGYSRVDGQWVKTDEWMESQGYVRFGGAWRIRQDIEIAEESKQRDDREKQWRRDIKRWRSWILKARGKQVAALAEFRAIRDPLAVAGIVEMLEEEHETEPLRLLYVDVLERIGGGAAAAALIQRALNDPSANVRDRALDVLVDWKAPQAVNTFVATLESKDNRLVNRAAVGLGRLADKSATLALINSLTTKHKYLVTQGSGGNLGASFGGSGNGGLNLGGGPKMIERDIQNQRALDALVAMYPGVNYGYNKEAWKQWYAEQNTPDDINLRRG